MSTLDVCIEIPARPRIGRIGSGIEAQSRPRDVKQTLVDGGIRTPLFAVVKDIRLPFSNLPTVNELIKEVPANERWVTDYWTMNTIVAVTDRPVYCIDLEKEISFILWKRQLTVRQTTPDRYTSGLHHLFQKDEMSSVYMITQNAPDLLSEIDPQLSVSFHVALIDKREGAIDRGSNLYLYRITKN